MSVLDVRWHVRAPCRARDLHVEAVTDGRHITVRSSAAKAVHVCKHHCPFVAECLSEVDWWRRERKLITSGVVQAGVVWRMGRPEPAPETGCGEWCRHLREGVDHAVVVEAVPASV